VTPGGRAWGAASSTERYAQAYELELGAGDMVEAARLYRQLAEDTAEGDPSLAGKALFRLGACERKQGRNAEAKEVWKRLTVMFPADHPLVLRANEEIKNVERELNRVTIQGRVLTAAGQAVSGAYVLVGDWGHTPPVATGADGGFRVERRVAGRLTSGWRYCLIYAEHPLVPMAAATVVVEKDGRWVAGSEAGAKPAPQVDTGREPAKSFDIVMRVPFALSGFVVDPNGRPVGGASIRVTGFTDHARDVPMPFSNLLPATLADSEGKFRVDGLIPGLRYLVVAEKDGYRLARGTEVAEDRRTAGVSIPRGTEDMEVVHVAEIVLQPVGRIFIDDQGLLRAEVNLNDPAERGRLDDMVKRFDEGKGLNRGDMAQGGPSWEGSRDSMRPFPFDAFPFALHWLRGDPVSGAGLTREDLRRRVTVLHFRSAYLDASIRSQFPGETGTVEHIAKGYGAMGVACVWIVPSSEDSAEAQRLAMETYADIPIAVDQGGKMWQALGVTGYGGNMVVDSKGMAHSICTDQQLFRVVKSVLAGEQKAK
jgi:hypothetical protein